MLESGQAARAHHGAKAGALRFARGEGIHWGDGELYFCCTSGGAAKLGQIIRLQPGADGDRLQLFVESRGKTMLDFGDNLTVAPSGHLVVCEDQYTEVVANRLIGVTRAHLCARGAKGADRTGGGMLFARWSHALCERLQPGENAGDYRTMVGVRDAAFIERAPPPSDTRCNSL